MSIPLPDVPDADKLNVGNDRMNETRQAVNGLAVRVQPLTLGGTAATGKAAARSNLGINSGNLFPPDAVDGDIYFVIV